MSPSNGINQFGSAGQLSSSRDCLPFEAMLADALDALLSPADQEAFDRHLLICASCRAMLADAKRGMAWLEMLRPHRPEPPAGLVERILAQTSVRAAEELAAQRSAQRAAAEAATLLGNPGPIAARLALGESPAASNVLPFRSASASRFRAALHTAFQPRYAMTAAMAFFSIALTLNLTGVRLSEVHARDLRPANLRRGFYEANAHVVRYYENLRVVYELESRVRDLQRTGDSDAPLPRSVPAAEPDGAGSQESGKPAPQPAPGARPRSSNRPGRERSMQPGGGNGRRDARTGEPHLTPFAAGPHPGASLPVSLRTVSPDRQKRGSV